MVEQREFEKQDRGQFLTKRDQQHLETAGRAVMLQMLSDYPHELPDGILYPETTARVFPSLFLPTLRKVAAERGVRRPTHIHFNAFKYVPAEIQGTEQEREQALTILRNKLTSYLEQYANATATIEREGFLMNILRLNSRIGSIESSLQNEATPLDTMRVRAGEIQRSFRDIGIDKPRLVIVDDMATRSMRTITGIRRAFEEELPAYVLLGEHTLKPSDVLFIGLEDPYAGIDPDSNVLFAAQGFDFYTNPQQKRMIGWKKDTTKPYAFRDPSVPIDGYVALRRDMGDIGDRIAESL